jgi:hypothetical protein
LVSVELLAIDAAALESCERIDMIAKLSQENVDLSSGAVGLSSCPALAETGRQLIGAARVFPRRG